MLNRQTLHLLQIMVKLKGYKFLWIAVMMVPIFSNHFVFHAVDLWTGNFGQPLTKMDASEFVWNSLTFVDISKSTEKVTTTVEYLANREGLGTEFISHLLQNCLGTEACWELFFHSLYGHVNASKYKSYTEYNTTLGLPMVSCQVAYGADLYCPFFGHLAAISNNYSLYRMGYTFGRVQFFSLTTRFERIAEPERAAANSSCAKHNNFATVQSNTIAFQVMLFMSTTFLYFLVGTISCIVDLKRNGFLRILFQKGLSVGSYWIAVWTIAFLEIALISALWSASHALQCLGLYSAKSVLLVLLATFMHLLTVAALGMLMTVIFNQFFHMGLAMVLIAICASVTELACHLLKTVSDLLKFIFLLLMPLGHLGEFTQAHLLSVILPDLVTIYHHLILGISILSPIVIITITLYLDFILKSGNGFCLHTNFPFDERFWSPVTPDQSSISEEDPLVAEELPEAANVEPMTEGLRPIVRLHQLTKKFKTRSGSSAGSAVQTLVALDSISAKIYEGQITAIIGHNGSGKTTLLNIINGSDSPTSGKFSVDGLLVNDPINRMRLHQMIGICPQENSLSGALTMMQTFELVLISCNASLESSEWEIESLMEALHLKEKMFLKTNQLSYGMKRKLCTAIALIGEPKLLFLDEPTSGVDPVSRRRLWKLLKEQKRMSSIVLSTQAMDEADTLADRKIFLSGGAILCMGSSLFLKSAFDCGFDFTVTLKSQEFAPSVISQIKEGFHCVRVKFQHRNIVIFHLPSAEFEKLSSLALAMERRKSVVETFGLLQISLYDIFQRLRDLKPSDVVEIFESGHTQLVQDDGRDVKPEQPHLPELQLSNIKTTQLSFKSSFSALVVINLLRVIRSRVKLSTRLLAPAVLLTALLIMAIVERSQGNARHHLSSSITNFGESFLKGVCLFNESSADSSRFNSSLCASALRGRTAETSHEGDFLVLGLPSTANLYEFLKEGSQQERIKSHCNAKHVSSVECPIVFADAWDKMELNIYRFVSVGSFSNFTNFNSSVAASVTLGAYYKLMHFFLSDEFLSGDIQPDQFKMNAQSTYEFQSTFISLYGTFIQLLIISLMPGTFIDDLIEDKETLVREQLNSIGMRSFRYWTSMFIVHWLQYALVYFASVLLIVSINPTGYLSTFYLLGIALPTLLLALGNNQLTVYILSSLVSKSNPMIIVAYLFFSIFLVTSILTIQLNGTLGIIMIALLPPVASIALTFYGTKAIFYTLSFLKIDSLSDTNRTSPFKIYTSQPQIFSAACSILFHALLLPCLLCLLEYRVNILLFITSFENDFQEHAKECHVDPGVEEEVQRLEASPRNPGNILEIRHLRMKFSNGAKVLRDITFSTSPGEIFGLLGPNGAGKSTTMAIIVGELRATGGRCEVRHGESWFSSVLAARNGYIGYCPQYNPLYPNVTVREHMEFYAKAMGMMSVEADTQIRPLLRILELDKLEGKRCSELSYGFKRRLSLAVALLGDPCLLVIDEASTGVDPEGKRILWQLIREVSVSRPDRSVVIATNSMEEAEALCSRIGIINQGLIIVVGSVQQVKDRHGQSYSLEVALSAGPNETKNSVRERRAQASAMVLKKFPRASIVEDFFNTISFSIPQSDIERLSQALSWLMEIKTACHMSFFTFYQMSLDQVFAKLINLHSVQIKRLRTSLYSLLSNRTESTEGTDHRVSDRI